MRVRLTNGRVNKADLVISAIGVRPNLDWLPPEVHRDADGSGILVDRCTWQPLQRCACCLLAPALASALAGTRLLTL